MATVSRKDVDTGYVSFHISTLETPAAERPALIERAFCDWMTANPGFTVRETLPIVAEGNTVALHVWFDG